MSAKEYDIALYEKEGTEGLDQKNVNELFEKLKDSPAYPIDLQAWEHESSAMGFITRKAAEELGYEYEVSGLHDFIADILDDMNKESDTCEYEFKGIKIWLSR